MQKLWRSPQRWLSVGLAATVCLGAAASSAAPAQAATAPPPKRVVGTAWGDLGLDLSAIDIYGRK